MILDSLGYVGLFFSVLGAQGASGGDFLAPEIPPQRGGFLIRLQHYFFFSVFISKCGITRYHREGLPF